MAATSSTLLPALTLLLFLAPSTANAQAPTLSFGGEATSDFKYIINNSLLDAEDIVTSPLYVVSPDSPVRSPKFYLVLAGAAAVWGGSFVLDQTLKSHLQSMNGSDADLLQNVSYGSVSASVALLYGYGLWRHDARARQYALTAGEGAGLATLVNLAIKAGPSAGCVRASPAARVRSSPAGSRTYRVT
jgi:hypothetical protein